MKKITILGCGMVGSAIAIDLSKIHDVLVADLNQHNLDALAKKNNKIQVKQSDITDRNTLKKVIADADLVIGAVPGFLGYSMVKDVIETGKNIVDISFFPEDPFELDELAKRKNVIAVVDCGVAPGMDNMILGYHAANMEVKRFECLVGGLPFERQWPYEYKAPFSPIDVLEEYTRPARLMIQGNVVTREALSEPELLPFKNIGTLESFNTDGLRTLLTTMNVPDMKEKTLRYPGHIEYMRVLRETGFLDKEPVIIDGKSIRPIDLTAKLLFPKWKYEQDEEEFTVMRVVVEGIENDQSVRYVYDLLDRYDHESKTTSMSRTTGYTCTAVANLVLEGKYSRIGISPPEFVGEKNGCLSYVLAYQFERGIHYQVNRIEDF